MKKVLRKYSDTILILLAVAFLGLLFYLSSWSIGSVIGELNRAGNPNASQGADANFNLRGARQLDLRGLVKP